MADGGTRPAIQRFWPCPAPQRAYSSSRPYPARTAVVPAPLWADHDERQRRKHGRDEDTQHGDAEKRGDTEAWTGPGPDEIGPDETERDDARPPDRAGQGPGFRSRRAAARSKRRSRMIWVW